MLLMPDTVKIVKDCGSKAAGEACGHGGAKIQWMVIQKWMRTGLIWGYPHFRKPPLIGLGYFRDNVINRGLLAAWNPRMPQVGGFTTPVTPVGAIPQTAKLVHNSIKYGMLWNVTIVLTMVCCGM